MGTKRERIEFASIMARECPKATPTDLESLMSCARRLAKIAERECNGHQTWDGRWDEEAAKRDERRGELLEARVRLICERIGCEAVFNGDPRGYALMLKVPSGKTTDWGQRGIGVPE